MKIAVLQGSPHKSGSSNTLAKEFIRGAKEAGHNVTALDLSVSYTHLMAIIFTIALVGGKLFPERRKKNHAES